MAYSMLLYAHTVGASGNAAAINHQHNQETAMIYVKNDMWIVKLEMVEYEFITLDEALAFVGAEGLSH